MQVKFTILENRKEKADRDSAERPVLQLLRRTQ